MALRQYLSPETLLKPFIIVKNTALQGWNEVARRFGLSEDIYFNPLHKKLERPVTVILIGAGNRGSIYADFAKKNPDEMKIVAVADPNLYRLQRIARLHKVPPTHCFPTWEDVFKREKFADAVIIATPDLLHHAPCMLALEKNYDVLLEKPIAPTEEQCRQILTMATEKKRIVGVCHVLRYTPYFRELKQILDAKMIGNVISIQHLEPIEYIHMSHSYVRGNWRNSKATTPIILAKSSHDADIIRWLVNGPADRVHCFGNLKWFRFENAPAGSTERCTDGCAVENTCPYSALQIYYRDRKRLHVFDLPEDRSKWDRAILKGLKTTNYGRCVYRMDNDQPDHLTVNLLFKNGVTAAFSMEAFVSYEGRRTRIMGSMGDIYGDMENFTLTTFRTGKKLTWGMKTDSHGGGDHPMVKDWVQAVGQRNPALLSSSIEVSVESHLMAFAAERSRLNNTIESIII
jgi:predicted dehydrogenase